jgi:magnesium-transporting ATPase (P-type)
MHKSQIFRTYRIVEKIFWVISALLTMAGAFGMLLKGVWFIYQDFSSLKQVLSTEVFYAIICFELTQMARIRLMEESHRMVLYHFVFMATLTFGREIFLVHNLDFWIAIGFTLMVAIYIVYYGWSHNRPFWKTDKDDKEHYD